MKKLLSILAAAAMLTAALPVSASAEHVAVTDETFAQSDFNGDGVVDMIDVTLMSFRAIENYTKFDLIFDNYTDEVREKIDKFGNYSGNGLVSMSDCANILEYMSNNGIDIFNVSGNAAPGSAVIELGDITMYGSAEYKPEFAEENPRENAEIRKIEGDINQDDSTDARDASILLSYYADSQISKPIVDADEVSAYFNGDVTGDGAVDARDASAVLDIYARNSTK